MISQSRASVDGQKRRGAGRTPNGSQDLFCRFAKQSVAEDDGVFGRLGRVNDALWNGGGSGSHVVVFGVSRVQKARKRKSKGIVGSDRGRGTVACDKTHDKSPLHIAWHVVAEKRKRKQESRLNRRFGLLM